MLRFEGGDGGGVVERLVRIERLQLRPVGGSAELVLELHGSAQAPFAERDEITATDLFSDRVVIEVVDPQSLRLPAANDSQDGVALRCARDRRDQCLLS